MCGHRVQLTDALALPVKVDVLDALRVPLERRLALARRPVPDLDVTVVAGRCKHAERRVEDDGHDLLAVAF